MHTSRRSAITTTPVSFRTRSRGLLVCS